MCLYIFTPDIYFIFVDVLAANIKWYKKYWLYIVFFALYNLNKRVLYSCLIIRDECYWILNKRKVAIQLRSSFSLLLSLAQRSTIFTEKSQEIFILHRTSSSALAAFDIKMHEYRNNAITSTNYHAIKVLTDS